MKKIICILILIIFLILPAESIFADSVYDLEEIGVEGIVIPDGYSVFTRGQLKLDFVFRKMGYNKSKMNLLMETQGMYLDAIRKDYLYEITVLADSSKPCPDFVELSDKELEKCKKEIEASIVNLGFDVSKIKNYSNSQANFIIIDFKIQGSDSPVYGQMYATGHEGKLLMFTLKSYKGRVSKTTQAVFREIIDGVRFTEIEKAESISKAESVSTEAIILDNDQVNRDAGIPWFWSMFFGLIITAIIHILPMVIYRCVIVGKPVESKKAKKVVIVDAVIVFILYMAVSLLLLSKTGNAGGIISSGAVIFWTFACYRILTGGTGSREQLKNANIKGNKNVPVYYFKDMLEFTIYCEVNKKSCLWGKGNCYIKALDNTYNCVEKGDYKKAIEFAKQALEYNPVGLDARFEMCTSYMQLGELEKAQKVLDSTTNYLSISKSYIAKYYRFQGTIEIEKKDYDVARACFLYSCQYETNVVAMNELMYIAQVTDKIDNDIDVRKVLVENNIKYMKPFVEEKPAPKKSEGSTRNNGNKVTTDSKEHAADSLKPIKVCTTLDTSPKAEANVENEVKFCHMCGRKLVAGSVFCRYCGTKIEYNQYEE